MGDHSDRLDDFDYSRYVDEYRFIPLTPELERILADAVSRAENEYSLHVPYELTVSAKAGSPEFEELARRGYLAGLVRNIDGSVSAHLTPMALRYAGEREAYEGRREAWRRTVERDERSRRRFEMGVALGAALIGAIASLAGVWLGSAIP